MNDSHSPLEPVTDALPETEAAEAVLPMPDAGTLPGEPPAKPRKSRKERRLYRHKDVNDGAPSFAEGLNVYKLIWVFIIACFIGVAWETFYVYYKEGVLMRRSGMLYGPFNQIYGMGALLFTIPLYRFRHKSSLLIFLASFALGLGFEFVCSWVQEMLFGSVSWEYSHMKLNIGGRTNLFYGVGWGIMGLIFLTHIWPFLSEMIERIPNKVGKPLTIVLAVLLATDLALSGLAVFRQRRRLEGVPAGPVGRWLDETYPDAVMKEKYPSMEFKVSANGTQQNAASPESGQAVSAENWVVFRLFLNETAQPVVEVAEG